MTVQGNFRGNSGEMLRHMALAGLGIARLGWFQVGEDVQLGRLVPLLEEFHAGELQGIYAVFFGQKHTAARVRCFVDYLVEKLGSARPWLAAEYATSAVPSRARKIANPIAAGRRPANRTNGCAPPCSVDEHAAQVL